MNDMRIISQHTKKIMEGCKEVACEAGLKISGGTLEYIITNKGLLELRPKIMIPTMYDFWVHDVDIIQGKEVYKILPNNPYESVINTHPLLSFYNDNNPDWMNIFIFYHVLGHAHIFQNNIYFEKTWDYDFRARALSDKKAIEKLREKMGENKRFVDYVIEFSRCMDNLADYYQDMKDRPKSDFSPRVNFYFDVFLKKFMETKTTDYFKEIGRYNYFLKNYGEERGETLFFVEVNDHHKDFEERFNNRKEISGKLDIMQYLMEHSEFLNKSDNGWMKEVIGIIRHTSVYFAPQIRTKILNEGWASYWHRKLFLNDKRIRGYETAFAKIDASVTSMRRVGLNPYGLGKRLLEFIEESADKGRLDYQFQKIKDATQRKNYDQKTNQGGKALFDAAEYLDDFLLARFLDRDNFQDFVTRNNLFVTGKKLNMNDRTWEYYVKSRNGEDYRQMVIDSLYHPPYVIVDEKKAKPGEFYLNHRFEGKQLVAEYIPEVMRAFVYFWRGPVRLETTLFEMSQHDFMSMLTDPKYKPNYKKRRVVYRLDDYKKTPDKEYI